MPATVFFTTVIGDYDDLPTFVTYDDTARYVCFSDCLADAPRPWDLVPIEPYFADNKVTNGFLKANAHLLFDPDCVAVWVDANLKEITLDATRARSLLGDRSVAVLPHLERASVEAEACVVAEYGLDHPERVARLRSHFAASGFADDLGLSATMLLVRNLLDPYVTEFDRVWWDGIARLSRRDQLTFDYALWRTGLVASPISVDWRGPNSIFSRVDHQPSAAATRLVANDSSDISPPDLLSLRMPELPPEYPDVLPWHLEGWDTSTLALLRRLNGLVAASGERLEGNYCHFDGAVVGLLTPPDPRRSWKREFLREAVRPARRVLEIGFNAGHSAAVILGSPSVATLVSVDLGEHSYARDCARAVGDKHPGRFQGLWGSSTDILPTLPDDQVRSFDLVHIDGGHGEDIFVSDLDWFVGNARLGCRLVVDDCYVPYIRDRLLAACGEGVLRETASDLPSSGENRLFALQNRVTRD